MDKYFEEDIVAAKTHLKSIVRFIDDVVNIATTDEDHIFYRKLRLEVSDIASKMSKLHGVLMERDKEDNDANTRRTGQSKKG